ncbi:hypothetical protein BDL97_06G072700 [Sphagnum fallax]|nr:hypothetical protein BDL97_06G072700 [Sphagnum fallax]
MAWRAFNALMGDTKLLVLDTRTARSYGERHIRGSVCVELSSNGRTLEKVAGPGPPTWSRNCWWGRNVLIVSPNYSRKSGKRRTSSSKSRRDDGEGGEDQEERERKKQRKNPQESADGAEEAEPVVKFLLKEGCVKSVKVLEVGDDDSKDAFSLFARQYPFLVTKSTKAASIPSYPAEIVPGFLYLGDLDHAKADNRLDDLNITHVVTIHTEPVTLKKRFVQLFFNLADEAGADIAQHFGPMFEFVEDARKAGAKVLVHCGAGASRSATLCAAYLMRVRGWNANQTLEFMKEQRKQVAPNEGFLAALSKYEDSLGAAAIRPHSAGNGTAAEETTVSPSRDTSSVPHLTTNEGSTHKASEQPWPPHLDVMKEGRVVGTVTLTDMKELVFGRAPTCDVVLDHASISRQHARISCGASRKVRIQDMGSAHGTFVNGKRLHNKERQQIHGGDVLKFGASTRSYILLGDVT